MRGMSRILLVAVVAASSLGCGKPVTEDVSLEVSGKVTMDGQPLEDGRIVFTPPDGGVPASCEIINGSYRGKARLGKSKVSISAFRVDPSIKVSTDPVKPNDNKVNYIPKQFNVNTTLTADITPGKLTFDFAVTK